MMMRVCQISVFMECRQRRRVQILLIIDKINLCPSVYSESSASGNINLTHPHMTVSPPVFCLCIPSAYQTDLQPISK